MDGCTEEFEYVNAVVVVPSCRFPFPIPLLQLRVPSVLSVRVCVQYNVEIVVALCRCILSPFLCWCYPSSLLYPPLSISAAIDKLPLPLPTSTSLWILRMRASTQSCLYTLVRWAAVLRSPFAACSLGRSGRLHVFLVLVVVLSRRDWMEGCSSGPWAGPN